MGNATRIIIFLVIAAVILAGAAPAIPGKPVIKADKTYFDVNSGLYILKGNVYIEFRGQVITAGQARANLATMEIWGGDGVTLRYDDIVVIADSAHVRSARSNAIISGDVRFTRRDLTISGEQVDFDWAAGLARFSGNVKVSRSDTSYEAANVVYELLTDKVR